MLKTVLKERSLQRNWEEVIDVTFSDKSYMLNMTHKIFDDHKKEAVDAQQKKVDEAARDHKTAEEQANAAAETVSGLKTQMDALKTQMSVLNGKLEEAKRALKQREEYKTNFYIDLKIAENNLNNIKAKWETANVVVKRWRPRQE